MADLKVLTKELEDTIAARKALHDAEPDGLSRAAMDREEQLHDRALKLHALINDARNEEKDSDFARLQSFLNDPQYRIPRGIQETADWRKMLASTGCWDIKDGKVYYQSPAVKNATPIIFTSEDVLDPAAPLPANDPDAEFYIRQTRHIFQPIYRKAYEAFLRGVGRYRDVGLAMQRLDPAEQKALSEGTDTAGGFLVPPDTQGEILVRAAQRSVMRRLARTVNTSRDRIVFPRVAPHATSGSIYSSGFVGGWVGETPAFSDTDPSFGTFEISIKKLRVATKVSNDFLADAASNVLQFLSQNGAENMALVEDNGFIAGDGTALQPLGLLNDSGVTTVDAEGSTADTISNTTAATGSAPKLINLTYALPSQYADGAQWLMRRAIEGKVRGLVDGNGRFLWPAQDQAFGPTPRSLMGYPVNNSEFMPAEGTNANKVLAYGDFSAYVIGQRAQISTVILRERFADTDQTGIIIFERVGGALWNPDAVRFGIV